MKISLENIGSIKHAEFDLDKDLIVFIGPNNTGKTYASYCIYGMSATDVFYRDEAINNLFDKINFNSTVDELIEKNQIDFDLANFDYTDINEFLKECGYSYKAYLPKLFGDDYKNFEKAVFTPCYKNQNDYIEFIAPVVLDNIDTTDNLLPFDKLSQDGETILVDDFVIFLDKSFGETIVHIVFAKNTDKKLTRESVGTVIKTLVYRFVLSIFNSTRAFFIPAERIGISVFSKDLFKNRFLRTNNILSANRKGKNDLSEEILNELNTYSKVIEDALNDYDTLTRYGSSGRGRANSDNKIYLLSKDLEDGILKGSLSINKNGDVFFLNNDNPIKIQVSGSIIKSLTLLVLHLKYQLYPGSTLIIDEPEINLHPDNQRLVARILAKLSKLGVKVIVSTHSDYFIRELNNLMMLNKDHEETISLREKYGYDESEVLDHNRVGAYLFKAGEVKEIEITETGMDAATIDDEINKLNNVANDIYWTLFDN